MLVIREMIVIFIAILSDLSNESGEKKQKNSHKSEDCSFIEKSLTGWLKAIVISNCEGVKRQRVRQMTTFN